jgi:signal transduction histidine kinase
MTNAQGPAYDSLKEELASTKNDTLKYQILGRLTFKYLFNYPDSALPYIHQSISLAKQMESDNMLSATYHWYAWYFIEVGDYAQALLVEQEALKLGERSGRYVTVASTYDGLATIYQGAGDYARALIFLKKGLSLLESNAKTPVKKNAEIEVGRTYVTLYNGLATNYTALGIYDSALASARICDELARTFLDPGGWAAASYLFGNIYLKMKEHHEAIRYYRQGIAQATRDNNNKDHMDNCTGLAKAYKITGEYDSSIYYAIKAIEISKSAHNSIAKLDALQLLAGVYQLKGKNDSTVKYLNLMIAARESLFNSQKIAQIQNMSFTEEQRQQRILDDQAEYRNKIRTYALAAGLLSALIILILLYRNNRQKQKARLKVEKAYAELKSTQVQLIQSEKMASLGELTAGIAHEIQNPLNFVNNFSEVNSELINELVDEANKGNLDGVRCIAKDIKDNGEKITHHGSRADSIVKGMLQHSRVSTGQKELTDINALAEEYLRLSYHGLRAKDKSFNADLQTHFDPAISKVAVIPQDLGRVLLNLYNNAFYAVNEKLRRGDKSYNPVVSVSTEKLNDKIKISVKDNGTGIPEKIRDKIFQPFFTTKPTGQGTGLGLSLSYDIIKAHGGEINISSQEDEGTSFYVTLPL